MHTEFKKGIYNLNSEPNFSFQLNRTVFWGGGDEKEIKEISKKIHSTETWVAELTRLGDNALKEREIRKAIAYYRMAEFFEFDGNPNKLVLYRKARELFYSEYARLFETLIRREYVAFGSCRLPVWIAQPEGAPKDTILIHGGNDSYMEEFLNMVLFLRERGFAVYLFEGPGQGEVLREQGMTFTHEWEKPVTAILDHYHLDQVTIVGLSLGGMLAPRAAAYEKRIKRVVAWSIFPNFLDIIISTRKPLLQKALKFVLWFKLKQLTNAIFRKQMAKDPLAKWGVLHGMHNMGVETPYDYLIKTDRFQILDIGSLIDQDVLLLGAKNDHFIPLEFYKEEIDSLSNVKSLTFRIFTDYEEADNHCNIGNTLLALQTIANWIEMIKQDR